MAVQNMPQSFKRLGFPGTDQGMNLVAYRPSPGVGPAPQVPVLASPVIFCKNQSNTTLDFDVLSAFVPSETGSQLL